MPIRFLWSGSSKHQQGMERTELRRRQWANCRVSGFRVWRDVDLQHLGGEVQNADGVKLQKRTGHRSFTLFWEFSVLAEVLDLESGSPLFRCTPESF